MSNLIQQQSPCEAKEQPCKGVETIVEPKDKDIGGFFVRRCLPVAKLRSVGPWIFFDHMGPAEFEAGQGVDVRPHPHINLATVTFLFEGEILHRDSLGNLQAIKPGDINLMVAGKGIVHSERERPEVRNTLHRLHGLQLWHALPEAYEETAPAFYHYPVDDIPATNIDGVPVRVMMGSAYGLTSPVKTFCETLYLEAVLEEGLTLTLPPATERAIYVAEGELHVHGEAIKAHQMALLTPKAEVKVSASKKSRIALIGGEPLGYRYMYWNFASSRKTRIEWAKEDWKEQRFDKVPGDEEEFIPLPD
ncbi:pirin family protein [Aliiglaciecola sp. CAU 1673]|uniref:pirin family protein n=1 Tax=Aliiglaciecola sp. CAU 1673 TaxID=3032595 RepID=UPI0023D9FB35|nr:pirin family protein [Aliiglaciecola sp. CAU 1673]MDF2179350.1 pirin family protein [Aliiglaciecola sp. CAU 1673]